MAEDNPTSVERMLSAQNLIGVLKDLLINTEIINTEVKHGNKSSANIYINKKYKGCKATVIIWKN